MIPLENLQIMNENFDFNFFIGNLNRNTEVKMTPGPNQWRHNPKSQNSLEQQPNPHIQQQNAHVQRQNPHMQQHNSHVQHNQRNVPKTTMFTSGSNQWGFGTQTPNSHMQQQSEPTKDLQGSNQSQQQFFQTAPLGGPVGYFVMRPMVSGHVLMQPPQQQLYAPVPPPALNANGMPCYVTSPWYQQPQQLAPMTRQQVPKKASSAIAIVDPNTKKILDPIEIRNNAKITKAQETQSPKIPNMTLNANCKEFKPNHQVEKQETKETVQG